jgi:alpha-L-arabinofuranosidase
LIHDATSTPPEKFFVTAGREDASGEIIVKAINVAAEQLDASLNVRAAEGIAPEANAIVLHSTNLSDNNSLEQPHHIVPRESIVENVSTAFEYTFPPQSFTVLRLRPQGSKPKQGH